MRYVRAISVLALILGLACSDATGPDTRELAVGTNLNLTSGSAQEVQVTQEADSVVATITSDSGDPVPGVLVSFQIQGDNCGSWAAETLETNDSGEVVNVPTVGTVAVTSENWDCTYEVVRSRDGRPDLLASVDLSVLPGTLADGTNIELSGDGDLLTVPQGVFDDSHGNPVYWRARVPENVAHVRGTDPQSNDSRTVQADSAGTGTLEVIVADTVACTGVVDVAGADEITEVSFHPFDSDCGDI